MTVRNRWLIGVGLGVVLILAGGGLAFWRASGPLLVRVVEERASATIGRKVTIGSLHISPGRIATITADDVVIANPPGWPASDPPLADIRRLVIRFGLWDYIRHRQVVIPAIDLQQPHLFVAETPDRQANYRLNVKSGGGSTAQIGALTIEGGEAHAALAPLRANFQVAIRTEQLTDRPTALYAEARGTYAGAPINARLDGGAILALRDTTTPWPVNLQVANGPIKASLQGTIVHPLALSGADLRLSFAGPSLSLLKPLIGIALPETPAFRVTGALDFANHQVHLNSIDGRIGSSDLEGTIAVAPGEPRPVLTANLFSRSVNLADLGGLVGANPHAPPKPENASILPTSRLSLPQFKYADVHLRYRADSIQGRSMPLDNVAVALDIVNGVVSVRPFSFGVGDGRIEGDVRLQPVGDQGRAQAEVNFQDVSLSSLMSATHAFQGFGALSGSARIDGTGASVAGIVDDGHGEIVLGMAGGNLSSLLVDLSGLEFGNAVLSALGLPQKTKVECLIADFGLNRGLLTSRALLLDTGEAIISGSAEVSLYNNGLRIEIRTRPKHFSIGSLSGPLEISGTLKHPRILPSTQTLARVGAAGVLAALFPPLAVLPTIQFGTSDHGRCEALLAQAREEAPGTKPPPPRTAQQ